MRVLIAIVVSALMLFSFGCINPKTETPSEDQVKQLILDDLRSNYPEADKISIVSAELQTDGSWKVKGRVTSNYSTPCPERTHITYEYPKFGFVPNPPEQITSNCLACAGAKECKIAFEEQAIIASHTFPGANDVSKFVYNNDDAVASAGIYDNYYDVNENRAYENVWLVKWSSKTANSSYTLLLDKNTGGILKTEAKTA